MNRAKVHSSNIAEIGYDAPTQTLEILFKSDKANVHRYKGVTKKDYIDFMQSESKGKFFAQEIKGKEQYDHSKVEADPDA